MTSECEQQQARQGQHTRVAIEPEHSAYAFLIHLFAVNHLVGATKFQYSQLNLTTQQPARSPSRVEKVVGRSPSGRTTWLTGGRGRHQGRFSPMFTGTSKKKKKVWFQLPCYNFYNKVVLMGSQREEQRVSKSPLWRHKGQNLQNTIFERAT